MCYNWLKTRTNVRIFIKNVAVTPCKNRGRWDNRRDLSAVGEPPLASLTILSFVWVGIFAWVWEHRRPCTVGNRGQVLLSCRTCG